MRSFTDVNATSWVASAREEDTPRHHGRWYLVFHREGDATNVIAVPEVRWQNRPTAERTLRTMSVFELRRRLQDSLARSAARQGGAALSSEA